MVSAFTTKTEVALPSRTIESVVLEELNNEHEWLLTRM
jgi:hypothetical protein